MKNEITSIAWAERSDLRRISIGSPNNGYFLGGRSEGFISPSRRTDNVDADGVGSYLVLIPERKAFENSNDSTYRLVSVRKLSVIFLSVFMIYAGAMWAFAACLRDDVHSAISVLDNHSDFQASVGHDHPQDPSPSVIHCTPVTHQVGPAARMAAAEILRSDKGVALDMVSFPYAAVSATLRNDLWLKVVFKRIVTFSSPIDLARHLFFSILQI